MRKTSIEITNLADAKKEFRAIALAMDPQIGNTLPAAYKLASGEIQEGLRDAAILIRDRAKSGAQAANSPRRLYSGSKPAIFAFSDFNASTDDRRKRSVLVGMRTGLSYRARDESLYVQWTPRSGRRKKDNSRLQSGGLSISFGSLFEHGTANGRIKPGRFFSSAISSAKSEVLAMITTAYYRAINRLNQIK